MSDKIAAKMLKRVWLELGCAIHVDEPLLSESTTLFFDGQSIRIGSDDGTVVELTARTVPAIDPGEVE